MRNSIGAGRQKQSTKEELHRFRHDSVYGSVKHDPVMPSPVKLTKKGVAEMKAARTDSLNPQTHIDGWANLLTGLGLVGADKRMSTGFIPDPRLTYTDLTYLYRSDGLAKRAINLPVNDMLRSWYQLEGDTDGKIELRMKEIDARKQLKRAMRLARLFGGSLCVLGINDGQTYEKPVREGSIKSIDHIHVFDRWRMTVNTADLYLDPANQKYGLPERYLITPLYGVPFYVHESRVLRFEGEDVTDLIRIQNQGWADSTLQAVWDRLRALGETYGNIETILDEFIIGKMTITNLQEMIAAGKEKLAQKRLNYVDMTKHIMNTVLLDKDEEYDRISATVTGIGDLTDRIIEAFCAVTGIPVCLFMGRSQAGLSNDEASQVRFYYDKIAGEQQEDLLPQLNRLINYINLSLGKPLEEEWFVRFNPLWQPTQKEIVEQRKNQAETDKIYIDAGVLLPEEVAASRFGGDLYSHDTNLMEEHKIALSSGAGIDKDTAREVQERKAKEIAGKDSQASITGHENKQQRGTLFGKDPQSPQPKDKPKSTFKNDKGGK
jgi:phage-related protein (TIGR01555 family)